MAELEVGGEFEALSRGDVPVGGEDHVCNGAAREGDAADELADEIEAGLLICDGHDDADRDEEDGADAEGQKEAVPGEVDGVVLDHEDAYGCHAKTSQNIP